MKTTISKLSNILLLIVLLLSINICSTNKIESTNHSEEKAQETDAEKEYYNYTLEEVEKGYKPTNNIHIVGHNGLCISLYTQTTPLFQNTCSNNKYMYWEITNNNSNKFTFVNKGRNNNYISYQNINGFNGIWNWNAYHRHTKNSKQWYFSISFVGEGKYVHLKLNGGTLR